jgi:hypothetical protein
MIEGPLAPAKAFARLEDSGGMSVTMATALGPWRQLEPEAAMGPDRTFATSRVTV